MAEAIVTLVILTIFLVIFFQIIMLIGFQQGAVVRESAANDIAYSNLQRISTRVALAGLSCTPSGWDLTLHGVEVTPSTDDQVKLLGAGASQELWAYPTNGCGASFGSDPIRVVSTVRYRGIDNRGVENVVVHASYLR